jgi:NAD(P)-dependent dehydrogenase (short-subunit alcohol dehydrogenase family)
VSADAPAPVSWHEGLLRGTVALVTGGSRGLGREIATAFSTAGAVTVIASRKPDSLGRAAAEIQEMTGNEVIGIPAHVGYWTDCEGLLDNVYAHLGRVDVLVNNAGIAPTYENLCGVSEELFDKTLAVNVKGPFRLGALAGARMVEHGGGSIINVSSVAGVRPSKREVPYGIAKAGLPVLTIGLALEYGATVRANNHYRRPVPYGYHKRMGHAGGGSQCSEIPHTAYRVPSGDCRSLRSTSPATCRASPRADCCTLTEAWL